MTTSYPVAWRGRDDVHCAGSLELASASIRLEGTGPAGPICRAIPYQELCKVRVGREPADHIGGRPTLVIETTGGDAVRIAGVTQSGVVSELAERLASLVDGERTARGQVVVVLPFRRRSRAAVGRLLEAGPPFDPAAIALDDHQVFLTDREAIFVFTGTTTEAIERLLRDPDVIKAARKWAPHLAGPPRLAHHIFGWPVRSQMTGWGNGASPHTAAVVAA